MSKKLLMLLLSMQGLCAIGQEKQAYKNIISVSPVQVSQHTLTGFGIQYERFLGSSGKLSFNLPVAYSFGNSNPCDPTVKTRILTAYPGIKFYPAGSDRKVSYSVGASVAMSAGSTNCNSCTIEIQTENTEVINETASANVVRPKVFRPMHEMGLLINNSLNINATNRLYFGSELGMGAGYSIMDNYSSTGLMLQFSLKVGYKF